MFPLKDNLPTSSFPLVTVILIALNFAVFGFQLLQPTNEASSAELAELGISERDQLTIEFGAIPWRILHPGTDCGVDAFAGEPEVICDDAPRSAQFKQDGHPGNLDMAPWWLTLITSMFMHAGVLHLFGNMLFLWVFGNNIEDSMGRGRFLAFYLLAGVFAVYCQAVLDPDSTIPVIGASGAVAGVLGAYALLRPKAKVLNFVLIPFFFTFIEIPALIMIALWMLLQFVPLVGQVAAPELAEGARVAYFAHVGGFIFGLAMIKLFARRDREKETAWN